MNTSCHWIACFLLCFPALLFPPGRAAWAEEKVIPESLRPWESWAAWGERHPDCPTPYDDAKRHVCFWPSVLSLTADEAQGTWSMEVSVFEPTWVPLPGSEEVWPQDVRGGDQPVVVVGREGVPAVKLAAGEHKLSGTFRWDEMPQRIAIPAEIGVVSLSVAGAPVPIPNWDQDGLLWLRRVRAEVTDKDLLSVRVYRVLEDGIPLWLRTEIELTVSGKSREEPLGWVLPQGWKLSHVESPIPVAVDEQGRMKAQVRAGKWTIGLDAFRANDVRDIQFAQDAKPVVTVELIGFRADPQLRVTELEGVAPIDASQTTFPEKWSDLPVYQWETGSPLRIVQQLRGMGLKRPEGLAIVRELWLDADGAGLTYRDQVQGRMQQLWRVDASDGLELGKVRLDGTAQLITANPQTGAPGVEIRTRELNMEAIGRMDRQREWPATGWRTATDSLALTLNLPPGWRAFAVFGADRVSGDWLTSWSLLDLFLLLVFAMAVWRMWGIWAGVVALVGFGLTYQEPGAPRFTWLFLLMPLALLRVVGQGAARNWMTAWKYLAAAALLLVLIPFVARQIQSAIYPQLEGPRTTYGARGGAGPFWVSFDARVEMEGVARRSQELREEEMDKLSRTAGQVAFGGGGIGGAVQAGAVFDTANLAQDPKSRIQTGPAVPDWNWNQIRCEWLGPVSAEHRIRPLLISLPLHRLLTGVRLVFLFILLAVLFGAGRFALPFTRRAAGVMALIFVALIPGPLRAEFPTQEMLSTLRDRLLEIPDAYPHAAEIAFADLRIDENRLAMEAEIHSALRVAVPLPGKLPSWSPVSVKVNGAQAAIVSRMDGYLWLIAPPGVHRVTVEGLLPDAAEWEWTFLLKPRRVSIDAPQWNVTGLQPDGVPEQQIFFVRKQQEAEAGEAAYDRREFQAIVAVERRLEIGLAWQVRNRVSRLSSEGKAVSLKVPLLPGERVLDSNLTVNDGLIDVRLGADENQFSWNSELVVGDSLHLTADKSGQWVERWLLAASPVWNVSTTGLEPVFEPQQRDLIPVWRPWPGEEITLSFSKPEAVPGDTATVQRVQHETSLGRRERTMQLAVELECSIGTEFVIELDADAEVSSLELDNQQIPLRRDGARLFVPAHPGKQSIEIAWRTQQPVETVVSAGPVRLPDKGSNVTTVINVPESRWVLWAAGPLRGPAVRFWVILACAILAAIVLGSLPLSPLSRLEWVLLVIGLTQVHVAAALVVVGWLFVLAWRGRLSTADIGRWRFNLLQVVLVALTLAALAILVVVVGEGLLGRPDMFIVGNNSTQTRLEWFQPRVDQALPEPRVFSISVWFYRVLMLFWALWLATALIRWLQWGWHEFSHGGSWKKRAKKIAV
jgi:hypothetical protein